MKPQTVLALLLFSGSVLAQVPPIEMVTVGDAGNAADTTGLGAVAAEFRIGTYEITNAQYVDMLNAVAADDTNGLYDDLMTDSDRGGILRSGSPGSYTYSLKPDFDDKPANGFTWFDAARYCNWLHNGMPAGAQSASTTEDGAYDMALPADQIVRKPGAHWFLPTHDEWYKAAYYDPVNAGADGNGTVDYWLYPTLSDSQPTQATASATGDVTNPGPNVANHSGGADWNGENGNVTTVGGCAAPGPWGTFDMGGNINEQTETLGVPIPANPPGQPDPLPTRTIRGGDFSNTGILMSSPDGFSADLNMLAEGANIGMRVASLTPWPDLGGAVVGSAGVPELQALGTLLPRTLIRLTLTGALANTTATFVLGFGTLNAPFKGGVLVPTLDILIAGLPTGPLGTIGIPFDWPPGIPSGVTLAAQFWVQDGGAPFGLAASNGAAMTSP